MTKYTLAASLFAVVLSFYSQASANEETTVKEFLTWERESQDSFFNVSILTAGIIATQVRQEMAECIGKWYTLTEEGNAKRHNEMLNLMQNYPDTLPTGVIVAVLQKQCGKFGNL